MKVEETLSSRNMKEEEEEEEEEIEETLSLCDLPLYSDQSADWDQYSSLNSNSTSSSSTHQDFFEFEFFTQQLRPSSAASFPPENIIFCGKLIPYKHLSSPCKTEYSSPNQAEIEKSSRWRWKLIPTKNPKRRSPVSVPSKNGSRGSTALMHQPQQRRTYNTTKQLGKAKWYFFLFGVSRLSPVAELSDIRNRQSRRRHRSQSPPPSPPRKPSLMFGFRSDHKASHNRGGWGLWGLIRALSCGGNHYPTAAVAAGGAPPE